jgi:opacity protein-like surface antigen
MKKGNLLKCLIGILVSTFMAFTVASSVCYAQEWNRKGKRDLYAFGQYMSGDSTTGSGITLELDQTIAGGLGLGYNINDNLNLNLEFFYTSTDVTGKRFSTIVKGDTSLFGGNLNLDINILKSRFSPLITGGIGAIRFDGDVEGFPFSESDFSYNVGGGFRWDVTNHFLIKAIYRATWTTLKDADKSILFHGPVLSIGYIF